MRPFDGTLNGLAPRKFPVETRQRRSSVPLEPLSVTLGQQPWIEAVDVSIANEDQLFMVFVQLLNCRTVAGRVVDVNPSASPSLAKIPAEASSPPAQEGGSEKKHLVEKP